MPADERLHRQRCNGHVIMDVESTTFVLSPTVSVRECVDVSEWPAP